MTSLKGLVGLNFVIPLGFDIRGHLKTTVKEMKEGDLGISMHLDKYSKLC